MALLALLCCGCHIIFPFDLPQASHDAAPDHALSDATPADFPFLLDYTGDLGFLCTCAMADANEDGMVDSQDFGLFKACFGGPLTRTCKGFDFNGDGVIGGPDWGCMISVFGTTCANTDGSLNLDGLSMDALDLSPGDLVVTISEGSISPAIQRDWCCADASGATAASTSFMVNGPKRVLVAVVGIVADAAVPDGTLQIQAKCTTCPGAPSLFQAVKTSSNQVFRAQLWYLTDPPPGQHVVEVTSGYSGIKLVALIASVWSGVDTFNPFYNNNPSNKLSGAGSSSFNIPLKAMCPTGSVAVDGALWIGPTAPPVPGSGQKVNKIASYTLGSSSLWLGSSYKEATPPTTTMGWSSSSSGFAAAAECLKAAP